MDVHLLMSELERDEGLRLKVYRDSLGIPTIGIGRNLQDRGISRDEAHMLLTHDVEAVFADLDRHLPWWRELSEPRQRVFANMVFNMGIERFLGFHNTLADVKAGRYDEAAVEMLQSAWAGQVGSRAVRLAAMMRGELPRAQV